MSYLLHQQNLPQAFLDKLPQSSSNHKYRNADKVPKFGLWDKIKIFFTLDKCY